ncbi:DUF4407 domain-containing protein [Geodermatophilus sp. CPCC 205506]|uniref:DUF4407 domain-containing protein n=1 Tax=Geodermatophilus sp. CPCC 205506 TaxID=2936596 RepID=UPI003EEAE6BB
MRTWIDRHTIAEVFLTVSGANRDVLEQAPRDRTKHVAMGIVLASVALIAVGSASYAFYLALHMPVLIAVLGGLVWGLIILNLDRWLVVSTPRLKRWWWTIAMALPRFGLAVLIGAVVSTPLTLAIFSGEIDTEIQVMAAEDEDRFTEQLAADSRYQQLPELRQRIGELQADLADGVSENDVLQDPAVADLQRRLDAVTTQYDAAEAAVVCETEGTCGSGAAGVGPAAAQKVEIRDRLLGERDALTQQLEAMKAQVREQLGQEEGTRSADQRAQLEALEAQVAGTQADMDAEIAAHQEAVGDSDGILARLSALSRIEEDDPALGRAHTLLFWFMTAIECLPILFKTMLSLAPPTLYETLVKLEDEKAEQRARLRLQTEYEEAETLARSALAAAEARAARTLEAESKATGMVLGAQLAVTRDGVRRWRDEQLGRSPSSRGGPVDLGKPSPVPAARNEADLDAFLDDLDSDLAPSS